MTALFVLLAVAMPLGVLWWAVRALRRWTGGWRAAAIGPAALVLVAIGVAIRGFETNPIGQGGEFLIGPLIGFGLCVFATFLAYVVSELYHAQQRRAGISTAPPNER